MSNNQNDDNDIRARAFKALSNPNRLALFEKLMRCCTPGTTCTIEQTENALRVGELGNGLGIAPSTLSHHLKELYRAGLVAMKRSGRNVLCRIDLEAVANLAQTLSIADDETNGERNDAMRDDETETRCCSPNDTAMKDTHTDHRMRVRNAYARIALADEKNRANGEAARCCSATVSGCCGGSKDEEAFTPVISTRLGYSKRNLEEVPIGSNMGLGCGNPGAIASLRPGEVVVDLGAGGGFDCFLAAREVGDNGRVVGIDMTPEMVSKARANARKGKLRNVEFRLGEIEHLPMEDETVDVIISNCVINLSPNKAQVFREAFRILRPAGRLAISDVVATMELPEEWRNDPQMIASCTGNASLIEDIESHIAAAGFTDIRITPKEGSRKFIRDWAPGRGVEDYVVSATIEAVKPDVL